MFGKYMNKAVSALVAAFTIGGLSVPSYALIPATGDGSGAAIPIVIGGLAVSAVLIVVFFVLSGKKK